MSRTALLVIVAIAVLIAAISVLRLQQSGSPKVNLRQAVDSGCRDVSAAFAHRSSGQFLTASAVVSRLLPDSDGSRIHQRFIVSCPSGQTVLIVNDISIGGRAPVSISRRVTVRGQYIWNSQGGLIHFTHHDPAGGEGGWIYVNGSFYSLGQLGTPSKVTSSPWISNA